MNLTFLKKVKTCSTSITAIGRASNTSDFYKILYPFDGIFDNKFYLIHVRGRKIKKKGLVLPTDNTSVNSAIVLRNIISLKRRLDFTLLPLRPSLLQKSPLTEEAGRRQHRTPQEHMAAYSTWP